MYDLSKLRKLENDNKKLNKKVNKMKSTIKFLSRELYKSDMRFEKLLQELDLYINKD